MHPPIRVSYGASYASTVTSPATVSSSKVIPVVGTSFTHTQKEVDPFQAALDAQLELERHEISERVKQEEARPVFALFCVIWGAVWCYVIQLIWAWVFG
jgi:hypothetical protein